MKQFEETFVELNEKLKPKINMIYSNSTKYSLAIDKFLTTGKAILTTSIDAGTIETFKKIRGIKGMNKVFENLERYYLAAKNGIIIKYILTEENSSNHEINSFIKLLEKHKLFDCSFQISTSYKDESLDDKLSSSAINLYLKL